MPDTFFPLDGGSATRKASVLIGGGIAMPGPPVPLQTIIDTLAAEGGAAPQILRVVVDTHLHMPDMFEITIHDPNGVIIEEAGLVIGQQVTILAPRPSTGVRPVMIGEITGLEAICDQVATTTVVRGYDRLHRLQRAKHTQAWFNTTDAEIATEIAVRVGLVAGEVIPSPTFHEHIAQFNQTDWEFLSFRASEIGYEFGVEAGDVFYFRPASSGLEGAPLAAERAELIGAAPLVFKQNLIRFQPSISADNLTPTTEVRMWDPELGLPVAEPGVPATLSAVVPSTPAELAELAMAAAEIAQAAGEAEAEAKMAAQEAEEMEVPSRADAGPPADPLAYVVMDRPVGMGVTGALNAEALSVSIGDQLGGTFAEAEGITVGDPGVSAGLPVLVEGVPAMFEGVWIVTQGRHVFDDEEGGYRTHFWVSGRQDRSLLGLTNGGRVTAPPPRVNGFLCGIVSNNFDLLEMGRVKFKLPWLSELYESDWARVVQITAGTTAGSVFLPAVGDEVLVGFEFGDIRRPFVLGGLINAESVYRELFTPATVEGGGSVISQGFMSPSGNALKFTDVMAEGMPPAEESAVSLGSWKGDVALRIDQRFGNVNLSAVPVPGEGGEAPPGTITIVAGEGGGISILSGGAIMIDAQEEITLASPVINIEAAEALNLGAAEIITATAAVIALNAE
ncbi:phage baseplate assembly protein V [Kitasatospora sp. NPDC048540]|uniref:phage baseplate assembly protein V n=1 Tax=unclassified Kitasatospora TaxID=2633591 RepID=UPI0005660B7B|nr:phage baseplate assembly protein V [Kitasatospora sp. MBT63]